MPIASSISYLVIDCADPQRLATFWTAALGAEIASVWNQYVILKPAAEGQPGLAFQQVPEPKAGKNRVHLDFIVDDLEAVTSLVVELGGTQVAENHQGGVTARVMADPEGKEFCLVHLGSSAPGA
ncbi:MAG: VOC family protein [Ilumatobacteraceae bacterium]